MSDYRDLSALPHDDEYWQRLEAAVHEQIGVTQRPAESWVKPLIDRAPVLGWLAAAALAALLLMPEPRDDGQQTLPFLRLPDDPLAVTLFASSPPSLATLLISRTGGSE